MSSRKDHITGPAFLLVAGRTAGMIATFAIAPLFARWFSVEEMGTYKTFYLLYPTLYGLAQLGMAESLYYFIPRADRERRSGVPGDGGNIGRYVCNAAISLLIAGLAAFALLYTFRRDVAAYFNNPAVVDIVVPLGLFLTLMLVGTVLEITMISRKQHMSAAIAYALSDIGRTALFIVPAWLLGSMQAVFYGAVAFAAIRLATMLVVVARQYGREFRPDLVLWRSQLGYALPFALAVSLEVILVSYHQYVVGGTVTPEMFAIYAMGCMTIPLVDLIMTSTTSVMMVKMAEHATDRHEALALFHDTVSRLAFLIAPVAIGLAVLAQPFIITLYTGAYAASVPIFTVWALTLLPAIFAVDAFLRVFAQTRFLLVMNAVRLGLVIALIGWFLDTFGLPGAVLVTLTATVTAKALALVRISRLLQVGIAGVLPWGAVARIGLRAAAAAVPARALAGVLGDTPWLAFTAGGAVYGIAYAVLCYAPGIAEPAAIRLPIMDRIRREAARVPFLRRTFAVGEAPHEGAPYAGFMGRAFTARREGAVASQGEK
jgi:O-antigen/teichoic acid export membrane protein